MIALCPARRPYLHKLGTGRAEVGSRDAQGLGPARPFLAKPIRGLLKIADDSQKHRPRKQTPENVRLIWDCQSSRTQSGRICPVGGNENPPSTQRFAIQSCILRSLDPFWAKAPLNRSCRWQWARGRGQTAMRPRARMSTSSAAPVAAAAARGEHNHRRLKAKEILPRCKRSRLMPASPR